MENFLFTPKSLSKSNKQLEYYRISKKHLSDNRTIIQPIIYLKEFINYKIIAFRILFDIKSYPKLIFEPTFLIKNNVFNKKLRAHLLDFSVNDIKYISYGILKKEIKKEKYEFRDKNFLMTRFKLPKNTPNSFLIDLDISNTSNITFFESLIKNNINILRTFIVSLVGNFSEAILLEDKYSELRGIYPNLYAFQDFTRNFLNVVSIDTSKKMAKQITDSKIDIITNKYFVRRKIMEFFYDDFCRYLIKKNYFLKCKTPWCYCPVSKLGNDDHCSPTCRKSKNNYKRTHSKLYNGVVIE